MSPMKNCLKLMNGRSMNGTIINHMLYYVDDICTISLSLAGLQQLLNICSSYVKSRKKLKKIVKFDS